MKLNLKMLSICLILIMSLVIYLFYVGPTKETYNNLALEQHRKMFPDNDKDFVNDGDDVEGDDMTDGNNVENNEKMKYTPLGISKSNIPNGEEDLYVLKSQIVPPVCPACPSVINCPDKKNSGGASSTKSCAPCPPCGRCPEPAFECKKVPNYSAANKSKGKDILPRAVLSDFSSFGM